MDRIYSCHAVRSLNLHEMTAIETLHKEGDSSAESWNVDALEMKRAHVGNQNTAAAHSACAMSMPPDYIACGY